MTESTGKADAYEIKVYVREGNTLKELKNFKGKLTVKIPYKVKPGQDRRNLRAFYEEDDKLHMVKNSRYSDRERAMIFKTDKINTAFIIAEK